MPFELLKRPGIILVLCVFTFTLLGQANQMNSPVKKPRLLNVLYERKKPLITYEGNMVVITPAHSIVPIVNPGKGWAGYGSVASQPAEVLNMLSLGYTRYRWGNIEPEEGVYRWDIIDNDIRSWSEAGKDFAFGIACASTHSTDFWTTPKWVFDAGAKYDTFNLKDPKLSTTGVPGLKLVPVFDDPVFMKKLENFIKALAARYDGHPNLAFIDIRSYGNWGEGHMHPFGKPDISPEKYMEHIQMHRDAFKKTLLVLPSGSKPAFLPVYDWAVSIGVGIRRDGICGNSNGNETMRCAGRMAAVFEFFGNYELMKKLGWWDGIRDKSGNGYRLDECVERGMPTYCDLSRGGKSGLNLMKSEPELISELTNRIGYHFVLLEAKYPKILNNGKTASISVFWENRGVAQVFIPVRAAFALLSSDGKIVQVCDATKSVPSSWKPDTPVRAEDQILFRDVKEGDYILAVGILRPNDGLKPSIKLGIDQKSYNGWYELGPVRVKR